MVTERDAIEETKKVRWGEMGLLDAARRIHQWATYADEALMDGNVEIARACIAVVKAMTER